MIIGRIVLSSKFHCDPAIATTLSFQITWIHTMIVASSWVGLTFPGIIEEPGSLDGMFSSCKPARGPHANQRISFANFINATASPRNTALMLTMLSKEAWAANLLGALIKGWLVSS